MPKRGQTQPWRLKTVWNHSDIKPFTEVFATEEQAISARHQRMRVDNVRGDSHGLFEITHRERPDYRAPEATRCSECDLWGTEYNPLNGMLLCADHAVEAWDEYEMIETDG